MAGRSIEDAVKRWVEEELPQLGTPGDDSTRRRYLSMLRTLQPWIASRPLSDIHRVAEDFRIFHRNRRPATANRPLALLRRIAKLAYLRWEWLDKPVAEKIRLVSEAGTERHEGRPIGCRMFRAKRIDESDALQCGGADCVTRTRDLPITNPTKNGASHCFN